LQGARELAAALVMARCATRSSFSSIDCSTTVSRQARMMPSPLQIRAPVWLSSSPDAIARRVLPSPSITSLKLASRSSLYFAIRSPAYNHDSGVPGCRNSSRAAASVLSRLSKYFSILDSLQSLARSAGALASAAAALRLPLENIAQLVAVNHLVHLRIGESAQAAVEVAGRGLIEAELFARLELHSRIDMRDVIVKFSIRDAALFVRGMGQLREHAAQRLIHARGGAVRRFARAPSRF
jgi:hypothetical protein